MARLGDDDAAARAANLAGRDFSEALARGLRIMAMLGAETRAMSLSDVARAIGLPRATVRRTLLTLLHLGYVEERERLFRLTPRILGLAGAYLGSSLAASILQPACEALSAQIGETVSVAVLDGADAVMIAYARPRSMYMESGGIGLRLPAHCSAVGRVLLAGLPEERRDAFLADVALAAVTPHTLTDRAALRALLNAVDDEGFALAEQEVELGFRSLAVPVRRRGGKVDHALNVGMSVHRAPVEAMRDRFVPLLRDAAGELGQHLL